MKKTVILLAVAVGAALVMNSCQGQVGQTESAAPAVAAAADSALTVDQAIERYLVDSVASRYGSGTVCIPCCDIIARVSAAEGVEKVLGDFWLYNYDIAGDTLKCVSGGNHPGVMTVAADGASHVVSAFEVVADGSGFEASAKRLFGDKYDAFIAVQSDDKARAAHRDSITAAYVKAHNLPVKYYQDYGWPARPL